MDKQKNKYYYLKGIKNGMPICLGYLAVSFTLGITARNAGMTAWQAMLTSLACNASAGQYAGFTVIAAGGSYFEMILMELVANARYLLMSCSLSQKFSSETGLLHRMLVGYDVTDEIFGVAVSEPGKLNPFYNYGMMTVAIPGWSLGTFFGVIMGNILPANIVSALSVGLYGMVSCYHYSASKKKQGYCGSGHHLYGFQLHILTGLPVISNISSGIRTIILTVVIAGIAAVLFPVKEEDEP